MRAMFVMMLAFSLDVPIPNGQPGRVQQQPAEQAEPKAEIPSADELVNIGASLADLKRWDEAINAYTLALKIDPRNGLALANRGLAYGFTNRLDEASRDLSAAEDILGKSAVIDRGRALIAMRRSDNKAALAELSKSLAKEPGNPFALNYRAWLYQDDKQYDAALADAESLIEAHPDSADAHVLKANLLVEQQKRDLAVKEAASLEVTFGSDPYAIAAAARIYDAVGQRARALTAIDKAIKLNPDLFYYHYLKAKFRVWSDFEGRRTDLNAALELDPNQLGAVTEMGLLEFKTQRWPEAISRFTAVLDKEPKDFGVLAYRAQTYRAWRRPDLAAKDYAAAMAAASGADDFNRICWAFAAEGIALDWGLEACDRAIKLRTDESSYFKNRGLVKLRLGQLDDAIRDYDHSIALDERNSGAYYGRAQAHSRKGESELARQDRKRALELNPQIVEVFEGYGLPGF